MKRKALHIVWQEGEVKSERVNKGIIYQYRQDKFSEQRREGRERRGRGLLGE